MLNNYSKKVADVTNGNTTDLIFRWFPGLPPLEQRDEHD